MVDLTWATPVKDLATTVAIVVGGVWALYRFVLARDHASNLYLSWTYDTHYFAKDISTAFITVRLENRGKRKLASKARRKDADGLAPAYRDRSESLNHACGLQFKELPASADAGHVSWYGLTDRAGIGEINLLEEFETSDDGTEDFHLEPGEVVEITVPVNLPKAHYIAKVHFVGSRGRMEFWSKLFWLQADGARTERASEKPPSA